MISVFAVALVLLWIFRARPNEVRASLTSPKTRLQFCMLAACLVPLDGKFPLAVELLDIPRRIIRRDEFWLIPIVVLIGVYFAAVLIAYALVSAVVKFRGRQVDGSAKQH